MPRENDILRAPHIHTIRVVYFPSQNTIHERFCFSCFHQKRESQVLIIRYICCSSWHQMRLSQVVNRQKRSYPSMDERRFTTSLAQRKSYPLQLERCSPPLAEKRSYPYPPAGNGAYPYGTIVTTAPAHRASDVAAIQRQTYRPCTQSHSGKGGSCFN